MIAEDREKRAAMGRSYDAAAKNSMNPDEGMKKGGKVKKYEEGGDVDGDEALYKANQRFEAEEAAKPKTRSIAAPKETEAEVKPKAKPTLKMGTAKEFAESGLTRTEYMNKINDLKPRGSAKPSQNARFVEMARVEDERSADRATAARDSYKKSGPTDINSMMKARLQPKPKATFKYASGGSVTRGDGCAQRGKTRGMMR
jgi:hypothetical protein